MLVLMSKGGVRKGAAFIFGWLLSLAAVVASPSWCHRQQAAQAQHGARPWPPSPSRSLIGVVLVIIALRTPGQDGPAQAAEEAPEVADRHRQHVAVGAPWAWHR